MVDQVDDDLKMELRESTLQHDSPEPKRSKPRENSGTGGEAPRFEESPEVSKRRIQRELMAAAAEKRMATAKNAAEIGGKNAEGMKDVKFQEKRITEIKSVVATTVKNVESVKDVGLQGYNKDKYLEKVESTSGISDISLSVLEADELFLIIFGNRVTKDVLAQWTNQGIRFSDDPATCMGLVQHEGGPCGVLAAIQAFVLKYLLFSPDDSANVAPYMTSNLSIRQIAKNEYVAADIFSSLSEEKRSRL